MRGNALGRIGVVFLMLACILISYIAARRLVERNLPQHPPKQLQQYSPDDLAIQYEREGRIDDAIAENRKSIGSHGEISRLLLKKGDIDGAIAEARDGVAEAERDPEFFGDSSVDRAALGRALGQKGDHQAALEQYRIACRGISEDLAKCAGLYEEWENESKQEVERMSHLPSRARWGRGFDLFMMTVLLVPVVFLVLAGIASGASSLFGRTRSETHRLPPLPTTPGPSPELGISVSRDSYSQRGWRLPMNRNQRKCIYGGIAVMVVMGIYPPWVEVVPRVHMVRPLGYRWLFGPPWWSNFGVELDITRLLVQCAIVVLIATGLVVALGSKR